MSLKDIKYNIINYFNARHWFHDRKEKRHYVDENNNIAETFIDNKGILSNCWSGRNDILDILYAKTGQILETMIYSYQQDRYITNPEGLTEEDISYLLNKKFNENEENIYLGRVITFTSKDEKRKLAKEKKPKNKFGSYVSNYKYISENGEMYVFIEKHNNYHIISRVVQEDGKNKTLYVGTIAHFDASLISETLTDYGINIGKKKILGNIFGRALHIFPEDYAHLSENAKKNIVGRKIGYHSLWKFRKLIYKLMEYDEVNIKMHDFSISAAEYADEAEKAEHEKRRLAEEAFKIFINYSDSWGD